MSDYIKREDAIKALTDCPVQYVSRICNVPSADVVEVVRCKECKHHEDFLSDDGDKVLCWVHDVDIVMAKNDYCSYGEPKEQEHE